jgi:hypothetical protein
MNISIIRRLSALIFGAQLLLALPARAAEDERFTSLHGSICRPDVRVPSPYKFPLITTAGIANNDPSAMVVNCPIPMTRRQKNTFLSAIHNTGGSFTDKCDHYDANRRPWVEVYDRNPSADVSCTLFVLGNGGYTQASFSVATTNVSQGPAIKLFFPINNYFMLTDTNRLMVRCSLPEKPTNGDWSYVARLGISTCEGDPPASSTTTTLNPTADTHVRDGTYAYTSFGTAPSLEQKNSSVAGNVRRTFLRFPLHTLGSTIVSAKLRLYGVSVTSAKAVGVYAMDNNPANTPWDESIDFAHAPAIAAKLGSSRSVGLTAGYVEWDLTAYIQSLKSDGWSTVDFEVKQDVANNDGPTTFNSREAASNQPQLVVNWQ